MDDRKKRVLVSQPKNRLARGWIILLITIIILGLLFLGYYSLKQKEIIGTGLQQEEKRNSDIMTPIPTITPEGDYFSQYESYSEPVQFFDSGKGEPYLLNPIDNIVVNENVCYFLTEGIRFEWELMAGIREYVLKIRSPNGEVYGIRVSGTSYSIPKGECSQIPEGHYTWWVVPLINGVETGGSRRINFAFEKFSMDYTQIKYTLTSIGCNGFEHVAVTLPNPEYGPLEWGYLTLKSSESLYTNAGDYQIISEGSEEDPYPPNEWIYLSGDIQPGDYIIAQSIYDIENTRIPDSSMVQTFNNAVNIPMPTSKDKWPIELQGFLDDAPRTIDVNWMKENYKDDRFGRNLIQELDDYIKREGMNIADIITAVHYIINGRALTYDNEKVRDAFDADGYTTENYIHHLRSAKQVYEDRKNVCNSYARYICSIFRAINYPCMTKTSSSMHMDPAIWIPKYPKSERYTIEDGEWVFLINGDSPYTAAGLLKTFSFGSSTQDYFNLLWYPECRMNVKFVGSVDDRLINPNNLKLIFIKPGSMDALNPNFLPNVKAKSNLFFKHHLIPFMNGEYVYMWKSGSSYTLDILNTNLQKVESYTLNFDSGDLDNLLIIRPGYDVRYNAKKYKEDYIILEIRDIRNKRVLGSNVRI